RESLALPERHHGGHRNLRKLVSYADSKSLGSAVSCWLGLRLPPGQPVRTIMGQRRSSVQAIKAIELIIIIYEPRRPDITRPAVRRRRGAARSLRPGRPGVPREPAGAERTDQEARGAPGGDAVRAQRPTRGPDPGRRGGGAPGARGARRSGESRRRGAGT